MASGGRSALDTVADDLVRIFAGRLEAVVAYGWRPQRVSPSLALVESLTLDDLNACADRVSAWRRAGAATPLLLTRRDFARSLDAFPIEYGEILATHTVITGSDPFEGLSIRPDDLRRACEVQAKSHLLHLREDYIESAGKPRQVDALVKESAPGFGALLRHLARLDAAPVATSSEIVAYASQHIRLDPRTVGDVLSLDADSTGAVDAARLFPAYLAAVERLAEFADEWLNRDQGSGHRDHRA